MAEDSGEIEKLYEYGEKLNEAKDKSLNKMDYEGIISAANGSVKAKQLVAQMIPKFFKYFPELSEQALDQHLYLCEDEELGVGGLLSVLCTLICISDHACYRDVAEHLAKIVNILGQLLIAGDNVEHDAVHKALVSLLRIMSGCCKPPDNCNFQYVSPTNWTQAQDSSFNNPDCRAWNNTPNVLCYNCQSCKAGLLDNIKSDWKRVAVINIIFLVFLIIVYSVGCCAFRNNREDNNAWKRYP